MSEPHSLHHSDSHQDLLLVQLIGTLVSAIVYGLIISLFWHCLILFATNKNYSTTRTRRVLIAYIVVMFLLSTVAMVQGFVSITRAVLHGVDPSSPQLMQTNEPFVLPFAIWGADGFMLRRCMILYMDGPRLQRALVYSILLLSAAASFGCGILYYMSPELSVFTHAPPFITTTMAISVSTAVNFVLTALICGRLWFHQQWMRRVLGPQYGSPYMRVIVMCSASCLLIVLTSLAYIALFAMGERTKMSLIPLLLLPHICAISTIFIVYHVARGRGLPTVTSAEEPTLGATNDEAGNENSMKMQPLQFTHHLTISSTDTDSLAPPSSLSKRSTGSEKS